MSNLASLVVAIEANTVSLEAGMKRSAEVTQNAMKSIEGAISGAKAQLIGLAASVVSVGAAVQSIRGAIALGDEIKHMADTTGLAVEKLDQLAIVAKLNSASLEDMAKGFKFLGGSMVEAQNASSKSGQLFAALGVAVKDSAGNLRGVDAVMGDVAKALNSIENETVRAAVGTAIFGKSYIQIAATLRNYEQDQKAANLVLEKFGGVSVTAANLADELGDKFTMLGEGSKRALLGALVPAMAAVVSGLDTMIDRGGEFQRSFGSAISTTAIVAVQSLQSLIGAFQVLGATARFLNADITDLPNAWRKAAAEINKIEADVAAAQARVRTSAQFPGLDDSDQISRRAGAQDRLNKTTADSARLAVILGASNKAAASGTDQLAKAMEALAKSTAVSEAELHAFITGAKELVPAEKELIAMMESDVWKTAPQAWRDIYEAQKRGQIVIQELTRDLKAYVAADLEGFAAMNKLREEFISKQTQAATANQALITSLDLETKTMFMTNEQRERAVELAKLEKQFNDGLIPTVEALAEAQQKLGDALDRRNSAAAVKKSLDEQAAAYKKTYDEISNTITDSIMRGFEGGKDWGKRFLEDMKKLFADTVLKPIIQGVLAPVAGGLSSLVSGGAQAIGLGGTPSGTGGIGDMLSTGNSLYSAFKGIGAAYTAGASGAAGAAAGTLAYGGGTAAGSAIFGATGAAELAGVAGTGAAVGGVSAGMAAGLAAVPVVGWVALAAIAAYSIWSSSESKRGGPKQGGSFATGDLLTGGTFAVDASLNQKNDQLKTTVDSVNTGFTQFAKQLGTTSDKVVDFGLAFDTDPQGTAANRVFAGVNVGGQSVYKVNTGEKEAAGNLGRDDAVLQARLGLEAKRMILAALQASDFPKYLGDLFKSIEVGTATAEQIDNITSIALTLKQAVDIIPILGNAFTKLDPASIMALVDSFDGVGNLATSLGFIAANFMPAIDVVAEGQKKLIAGFGELGIAIPKSHAAFLDLLASFDLTTDSGRELYTSVIALSGAFIDVKGTAQQAAEALKSSFASLDSAVAAYRQTPESQTLQNTLNTQIAAFVQNNQWAAAVADLPALLTTLADSVDARADFSRYSTADQALIRDIITTAGSLRNQGQADSRIRNIGDLPADQRSQDFVPTPTSMEDLLAKAKAEVEAMLKIFSDLAAHSTGDFGARLALQIQLVIGAFNRATKEQLPLLKKDAADMAASLALFNSLKTRYGAAMSEQLVNLTTYYKDQSELLKGNAAGLDVLNQVFEEQWTAIINGTAKGVDGTLDQLKKLQQGILDYVDSLKISTLSPLTPTEKLAEARSQYETNLTKASTGDQKALGDITGSADAYIKLARDYYASSANYTDIFNKITQELTTLGTADLSVAPALNAADQALIDALPVGSKLISVADLQDLNAWMAAAKVGAGGIGSTFSPAPSTAPMPILIPPTDTRPHAAARAASDANNALMAARLGQLTTTTAELPIAPALNTAVGSGFTPSLAPDLLVPMSAADQALFNALPTASKLLSVADLQNVASSMTAGSVGDVGTKVTTGGLGSASVPILTAPTETAAARPHAAAQAASDANNALMDARIAALAEAVAVMTKAAAQDADTIARTHKDGADRIVEAITVGKK